MESVTNNQTEDHREEHGLQTQLALDVGHVTDPHCQRSDQEHNHKRAEHTLHRAAKQLITSEERNQRDYEQHCDLTPSRCFEHIRGDRDRGQIRSKCAQEQQRNRQHHNNPVLDQQFLEKRFHYQRFKS